MKRTNLKAAFVLAATVIGLASSVTVNAQEPGTDMVYTVKEGDTLTRIARSVYGDENAWQLIYENNKDSIRKPDLIYVQQQFVLPYTSILTGGQALETAAADTAAGAAAIEAAGTAAEIPAVPETAVGTPAEDTAAAEVPAGVPAAVPEALASVGTAQIECASLVGADPLMQEVFDAVSAIKGVGLSKGDYMGMLSEDWNCYAVLDITEDPFAEQTKSAFQTNATVKSIGVPAMMISYTSMEKVSYPVETPGFSLNVGYIFRGVKVLSVDYE